MGSAGIRQQWSDQAQKAAKQTREAVRRAASDYIDFNERVATRLFDAGERMAERVEETPLYPLIEFQQMFARKAFEYWLRGARLVVEKI
jgi:hypothetical protein